MEPILTRLDGAVFTITINRPEVRNALNPAAYAGLQQALMRAGRPDVRAVVITGAGDKAFCSGHDLSAMQSDDPAEDLRFVDPIIRAVRALPKPVIAAVNGVAVGGGLSLALAADVRMMADTARLVGGFMALGLVPDLGASWLLVRALGYHRALAWAATGAPLSAAQAHAAGLACSVVSAAELATDTAAEAARLAALPTIAYGETKRLLTLAMSAPLETSLEAEAQAQAIAGRTQDYSEGLAAFRDRRPPCFEGR
jgi:2-(1,2-epoxy-1,2-dihydrophenyl)acetyl-CoA isomerase